MPSACCQVSTCLSAGEPVILEQPAEPLARAGRVAGEDGLAALLAQARDVIDDCLVDVGAGGALGREIAGGVDGEIEDGGALRFVEGGGQVGGGGRGRPFVGEQVERLGGERAVAAGLGGLGALAVLEIVEDRVEAAFGRLADARVADDHRVAEMVEQRRQLVLEQREPMLHAGEAAAFADRLVERVAGRGGAEQVAVAAAEALDRFLVEQRFGRGEQGEAVEPAGGALVGGVEGADALDLVAEEVEAERLLLAGREQVDEAAADRELALIVDGVGADVAVGLEELREAVAVDPLAGREGGDELADAERGDDALGRGVGGGEEELRPGALGLQAVERGDALGHDAQAGRGAVVGEAVPGGKLHAPRRRARRRARSRRSRASPPSSGAMNTARPAARARSPSSDGWKPVGHAAQRVRACLA